MKNFVSPSAGVKTARLGIVSTATRGSDSRELLVWIITTGVTS